MKTINISDELHGAIRLYAAQEQLTLQDAAQQLLSAAISQAHSATLETPPPAVKLQGVAGSPMHTRHPGSAAPAEPNPENLFDLFPAGEKGAAPAPKVGTKLALKSLNLNSLNLVVKTSLRHLGEEEKRKGEGEYEGKGKGEEGGNLAKPTSKATFVLPHKLEPTFMAFWEAYPKKRGKQSCRVIWHRLRPTDELLQQMLSALEWQRKSHDWQRDDGQYIPLPATWLNQHRWEDEPPAQESPWGW